MVRNAVQAASRGHGAGLGPAGATAAVRGKTIGSHALDPDQRFDGADEDCGRPAGRLGDHVQTVVHPVDKVHVGDPGRPGHDVVASRRREAGMRGAVLRPSVRLGLDDAPLAPPGLVVTDQARPEQSRRDLLGSPGQPVSIDDAQAGVVA